MTKKHQCTVSIPLHAFFDNDQAVRMAKINIFRALIDVNPNLEVVTYYTHNAPYGVTITGEANEPTLGDR